ncbi:MAG TPA: hypothetical protein VMP00_14140 [Burkholderiales bacterium]|nr:hypothetical protein [Burkholderiales bacterium]
MKRRTVALAGLLVLIAAGPAASRAIPVDECIEGGEFIKHAAMSRDSGITREFFMDRLTEDIMMIQAFPPPLRWFVQDDSDEKLLTGAAARVFDEPRPPEEHETAFIEECMRTSTARNQDRPI